jgi:NADH:ubiquinone oxidoreductase subunit 2 (subunit N)
MGLITKLIVLGAALGAFVAALILHRRPRELGQVSLLPYGGIQFAALVLAVLMVAHLISLLSGAPLIGRFSGGRF